MSQPTQESANERFEVIRELGRGGMGLVLEAYDSARGVSVALKVIPDSSAVGVLSLKREFRVLADLQHPNLVRLLDLVVGPKRTFFTMELVDGVDFLSYCRPGGRLYSSPHSSTVVAKTLGDRGEEVPLSTLPAADLPAALEEARLRGALEQLVRGLSALHAEGLIHRDVKPSNCMVSRGGRVVLLDFGLVQPVVESSEDRPGRITGTIAYMAPEQARGETSLRPAADWYAVGVMLYEALTGVLPFMGSPTATIVAKLTTTPAPVLSVAPMAPRDLAELAMNLLSRDAADRPDASAILASLTGRRPSVVPSRRGAPLLHREKELAAIEGLLSRVGAGRGAIALIRGVSGAGKSVLLARGLEAFRASSGGLVLTGRCYPREVVPFNAFDRVIDQLAALPERTGQAFGELTREEAVAVSRIFPALGVLSAAHHEWSESQDAPLASEARVRARELAFHAVRKLLGALAAYGPLVIALDDIQWADADSLALCGALANATALPGVALIASYRQADEAPPRLASQLRRAMVDASLRWHSLELEVGALEAVPAIALAESLIGASGPASALVARSIARATGGIPIGIVELAKLVREETDAGRTIEVLESVDQAIQTRLARLPAEARRVLELVAVSEGPLLLRVARHAQGETAAEDPLALLMREHWVREERTGQTVLVDTQHDRLREVVAATLTVAARQAHHKLLARVIQVESPSLHDQLAHHHAEAGNVAAALEHATKAADEAMELLAFDRAARLLGRAASLASVDTRGKLSLRLVRALVAAGRGSEAAEVALPAAEGRTDQDARELRRLAAEGLLQAGRIDKAMEVYRRVAEDEDIRLPAGRVSTVLSLLAARAALRMRSLEPRGGNDEAQRRRIEVLSNLSSVLLLIDPLSGALVHSRRLTLALDHGSETQVAVALAVEGAMRASTGDRARGKQIADDAVARAQATGDPYAIAASLYSRGIVSYTEWRLTDTERDLHASEALMLGSNAAGSWELTTGRLFRYFAAISGGRYRSALHDLAEHREDARRRRDVYGTAVLGTACAAFQQLALDQPGEAHRSLDTALEGWPEEPFLLPHLLYGVTRAAVMHYELRFDEAHALVRSTHVSAKRAGLLRHHINRARVDQLMGSCSARVGDLRRAKRHAHALVNHPAGGMAPAGRMILGGMAAEAGDLVAARRELRAAVDALRATEFASWRAAACAALAHLVDPPEAAELRAIAEQWVTAEGIVAPHRLYGLFVPWSVFDNPREEEPS